MKMKIVNNKSVAVAEAGSGRGVRWCVRGLRARRRETQLWCGKQSAGEYQGHSLRSQQHTLKDKPEHGGLGDF